MGKLGVAAAATGVGGTGAAGIYGAHHLGAFGGGETKATKTINTLTGTMEGEKAPYANECLKKIFQDAPVDGNLSSLETNFTWKNSNAPTSACLVYNWDKKNKDQNYKGSVFRLVWTMSKDSEGVAVHLTATVKTKDEMEFEGYSYIFEKTGDNWEAKNKLGLKEASNNKKILSPSDWPTKFPRRGNTSDSSFIPKTDGANDHYWCFLNSSGSQVQDSGGNNGVANRNLWWAWRPNTNGIYQLKKWSHNIDTWWNYFFDKDKLDMLKLMDNDSVGSWDGS